MVNMAQKKNKKKRNNNKKKRHTRYTHYLMYSVVQRHFKMLNLST